ncbi:protein NDUFAF4 homolog [Uranotaenia lowii]|uniref:protein NDUFAF4 homolog n=1 Tax=Uranotaenia lowii TaxID=190385 RepID=UPI0024791CD8|nr:protein NDUFAF4 homolog [Uranotaenia lowii]
MGKVLSVISRQANRFNVENRAEKVISQNKPKPAPTFSSNQKDLERILQEYPEIIEEQSKKHGTLDDNLRHVYVTSTDKFPVTNVKDKPLPLDRTSVESFELGHLEPTTVAKGRCSLRQAMTFISNHQVDPNIWNVTKIANDFQMKEALVEDILKHFKTFELHIPTKVSEGKQLLVKPNKT